jgi:protein-tyrosine phosphatase
MLALSLISNPADQILTGGHRLGSLWVGSILAVNQKDIGLVVSLCPVENPLPSRMVVYSVRDHIDDQDKLVWLLPHIMDTIHQARLRGLNVLVHCHAGMQRAPTVVTCYLKQYYYSHLPISKIIKKVRRVRPIAFANGITFKGLLRD